MVDETARNGAIHEALIGVFAAIIGMFVFAFGLPAMQAAGFSTGVIGAALALVVIIPIIIYVILGAIFGAIGAAIKQLYIHA